ncbi:MAG: hypothetical protein OZ948_19555 [Deltaproteobacteria bacterium]|nr:hypothetical protein [Deltaproteobacteria bacterium]
MGGRRRLSNGRQRALLAAVTALSLALLGAGGAPSVLRVPQDHATLQQAIANVAVSGDVIELAPGVYPSPAVGGATPDGQAGFFVSDIPVDFTIRAVPGAEATLDGEGARPVLRLMNTATDNVTGQPEASLRGRAEGGWVRCGRGASAAGPGRSAASKAAA